MPAAEPPGYDADVPSVARVYDCWIGGTDNFAADRAEAGKIEEICPGVRAMARSNREFIGRAVTWAAQQGIRQFIEATKPGLAAVKADVTEPGRVLEVISDLILRPDGDPLKLIDLAEPACLILGLVLHFLPADRAREVAAGYTAAIVPGNCVAISVGRNDDEELWGQVRDAYAAAALHNHTRQQVAGFFDGLELVPPGLAVAQGWRGGWQDARVTPPGPAYVLAGVGRKA